MLAEMLSEAYTYACQLTPIVVFKEYLELRCEKSRFGGKLHHLLSQIAKPLLERLVEKDDCFRA